MKRWKALLSLLMCAVMILPVLAACSPKVEYTYGRYVEQDISPEGMDGSPMNFVIHKDGTLDVVAQKIHEIEENKRYRVDYSRWRSSDNGNTWEQLDMSWLDEYTEETVIQNDPDVPYVRTSPQYMIPLASGGMMLGIYTETYTPPTGEGDEAYGTYESTTDIFIVDAQGNMTLLELEGMDEMGDAMQQPDGMAPPMARGNAVAESQTEEETGTETDDSALPPEETSGEEVLPEGDTGDFVAESELQVGNLMLLSDDRVMVWFYGNYGSDIRAVYDPNTGKKIYEVEGEGWQSVANDTTLFLFDYSGVITAVNIEDGTPADVELPPQEIQQRYFANFWGGGLYADNEGNIYQVDARGAYKFNAETTDEPEKVMDGINYTYGSPIYYISGVQYDAANDAMVMNMQESSLYSGMDYTAKLVRYVWDDEAIATSSRRIKVYSLYDSGVVRLALSEFKRANPDITIEYEVAFEYNNNNGGMMPMDGSTSGTDTNAKTVEDALRALNVEMLNGTGPDVLILDGMPIGSFVNQGVLEDLSALLGDNSDLFEPLMESMRMNGGLYAFPAKIYVPTLFGEDGYVQQFTDLDKLVQSILNGPDAPAGNPPGDDATNEEWEAFWNEQNKYRPLEEYPVIYFDSLTDVMSTFYGTSAPAIYSELGGVDEQNLAAYMQAVQQVGEKFGLTDPETDMGYGGGGVVMSMGTYSTFEYSNTIYRYGNRQSQLGYQALGSMYDLTMVASMLHWSASPDSYGPIVPLEGGEEDAQETPDIPKAHPATVMAPGLAQGVFFPQVIAGVASYTPEKDLAMGFVATLLSTDVQKHDVGGGFPVSRSAFALMYEAVIDSYSSYWTQEGIKEIPFDYEELMDGLSTPNFTNEYVDDIIMKYTQMYCTGEMTLDEAVRKVADETRMYFAERQ